ncbi:MAG: hypothetical protein HKN87_24580 [Saprospiraceae bacterium]|nr:hypothetical protein [Saprospiraceae bacterium]
MKALVSYLMAALLIAGAVAHVVRPEFYVAMIPSFIPPSLANLLAALAELVVGVAILVPRFRFWGGLGFALLMIAFLPLHIWDLVRADPVMGSASAAFVRLLLQLILIYAGWWIYQSYKK